MLGTESKRLVPYVDERSKNEGMVKKRTVFSMQKVFPEEWTSGIGPIDSQVME